MDEVTSADVQRDDEREAEADQRHGRPEGVLEPGSGDGRADREVGDAGDLWQVSRSEAMKRLVHRAVTSVNATVV
ncbi:hypothetical protein OG792_19720 [Micromonospora sp. NBC_01699]|uniref:hypothetical protein n=1 Tax=Micromonospora sp. NBC_01699 TaxID=2975984 RepID=UPI002E2C6524|nr:hypothetical protein [Micromonospora sp. NBC_01699]